MCPFQEDKAVMKRHVGKYDPPNQPLQRVFSQSNPLGKVSECIKADQDFWLGGDTAVVNKIMKESGVREGYQDFAT